MIYNDKAVLENFHASAVFRIMKDENYNILANLKKDEYRSVNITRLENYRSLSISYVATKATYIHLLHGKIGFLGGFSALAP